MTKLVNILNHRKKEIVLTDELLDQFALEFQSERDENMKKMTFEQYVEYRKWVIEKI